MTDPYGALLCSALLSHTYTQHCRTLARSMNHRFLSPFVFHIFFFLPLISFSISFTLHCTLLDL